MTHAFGYVTNDEIAEDQVDRYIAAGRKIKWPTHEVLVAFRQHVIDTRDARWGSDGPGQPADVNGCDRLITALNKRLEGTK